MSKSDGGPAFPCEPVFRYDREAECEVNVTDSGMSMRDWFAGQALVGGLAYCGDGSRGSWHNNATPEEVATLCYDYADAMLAERDR